MVQDLVAPGRRARNRAVRHRAYLDTALRIATAEGLEAVTMQRLAAELDCAVGTVYTYFPSKGALVAAVQREAIERLAASFGVLSDELDARLRRTSAPAEVAALTHVLAFARFSIDASRAYPQETFLLQQLMSATPLLSVEDAAVVVPAAFHLLGGVHDRIGAAVAIGALGAADAMDRTVALTAAVSGVLQVGRLRRWDPRLLDGDRLARGLVDDVLLGWGAELGALAAAHAHLDALARKGPLARRLPEVSSS